MSSDTPTPRLVAGLWCQDVLELLPDVLDGNVSPDTTAQVEAHLADCSWCASFGQAYGATLHHLQRLPRPESPPSTLAQRLLQALHED